MNFWAIIPLASCLTFTVLSVLVIQQAKTRVDKIFVLFLFSSAIWSFFTFMLDFNLAASTHYLIFWNGLVITAIPWVVITYYHFIRAYENKHRTCFPGMVWHQESQDGLGKVAKAANIACAGFNGDCNMCHFCASVCSP